MGSTFLFLKLGYTLAWGFNPDPCGSGLAREYVSRVTVIA
jgi:hypothetical protein